MAKHSASKLAGTVADMERDLELAQTKVMEQAQQIGDFKKELDKERKVSQRLQNEIDRQKRDPLHEKLAQAKRELKEEKSASAPKKLRKRIQTVEALNSTLESRVSKLVSDQELNKLQADKEQLQADLRGARQHNDDLNEVLAEARAETADAESQLSGREDEIARLGKSLEETKAHLRVSVNKNKPKGKAEAESDTDES